MSYTKTYRTVRKCIHRYIHSGVIVGTYILGGRESWLQSFWSLSKIYGQKNTNVKKRCVVWAYCYLEDNLKKKKLNSRHQNITALDIIYNLYIISYNASYFSTSPIGIFEYLSLSSISEVEKELVICIGLNLKNINEYRPVDYAGLIFFSINPLI